MKGGGEVSEVVFTSGVCTEAPKVQICPKTFVHDCSFPTAHRESHDLPGTISSPLYLACLGW